MKKSPSLILSAAVAASLLTAVSCNKATVNPTDNNTPGALRVSAPFADQTTQFAFDLTKRVTTEEGINKNVFVSPLSLHIALGMLMNGANGQTAQEIQNTLKLDAQTLAEANSTYQNLIANLPSTDPKSTVALANSVWYRNTFSVETSFQNLLKQTFKADLYAEDFGNQATVGTINNWASQHTNGKIQKVIDEIDPNNVMFLMNALYFKGDWKAAFNPEKTVDMPFTLPSGGQVNVSMMRQESELRRAFKSNYTAFELPYDASRSGGPAYVMTVLLPAENTTVDAMLGSFSSSAWSALQQEMAPGKIDIGLPKFSLSYEIKLNSTLSAMGMPTAFSDRADFTRINARGGLLLSMIKQNTYVAVDEKGTEAAAVTTGGVSVTSAPIPYLCNRPFAFVIHEKNTSTVLFVGKIANPTTNS